MLSRCSSSRCCGKKEYETRTMLRPLSVFNPYRTVMHIHNPGDDRQTQANSSFFRRHKRIENLFAQLGGNSRSTIFDANFYSFAPRAVGWIHGQPQCSSVGSHRVISILNQIDECLLAQ